MSFPGSAKDEILERIRRANSISVALEASEPLQPQVGRGRNEVIGQFAGYVAEYRATVIRCEASSLPKVLQQALKAKGGGRVVVPSDLPAELLVEGCVSDASFDNEALDQFQSVITTCAVGVAETGTIVLDAGPGQGRRALSLIPDHHLCVVYEEQVVDSVPEAVSMLEEAVREGRPLTWISGPSATSDIELSRVEGVHGPRVLDVVIVRARS